MYNTLILLGGNFPKTPQLFAKAKGLIASSFGSIIQYSSVYKSRAWGFVAKQDFLNQVIEVATPLKPEEQIKALLQIEKQLGRKRKTTDGYSSRSIDIDILFIDDLIIETAQLTVPHPRLHLRRFTLAPLCEHWSDKIHPKTEKSLNTLLSECTDKGTVAKTAYNLEP
ncbi:MAG: 2-amino-4-hydroxy-6-hydroxymethyldihydropteridine diphosphokinase [Cytophagaceae bacterium]|jgi:2-amino-4-hydroxy-6-hydroxymethyldihydropteridine diphosphokinase|nr:2-amino-4-hydroxy-6-hydroxymethyldihydropteridine diphosphokinase [Cytophagaceae bacterium]